MVGCLFLGIHVAFAGFSVEVEASDRATEGDDEGQQEEEEALLIGMVCVALDRDLADDDDSHRQSQWPKQQGEPEE